MEEEMVKNWEWSDDSRIGSLPWIKKKCAKLASYWNHALSNEAVKKNRNQTAAAIDSERIKEIPLNNMDVNVYGKNLKRVSLGKKKCVKKKKKKFWELQHHVVLRKICGHVALTSSRKNRSEGDNAVLSLGGN